MNNDSLLDLETREALVKMALPLKLKLMECQKHVAETISILGKLQIKLVNNKTNRGI